MPDRILSMLEQMLIIALIGAIPTIGAAMVSAKLPPWRVVLGRCLINCVLTTSAFSVLSFIPDIPQLAVVGLAAVISTLGKSKMESFAVKALRKKGVI